MIPETFRIISPVDGSIYGERSFASREEINGKLESAFESQRTWQGLALNDRMDICTKAVQLAVGQADQIGLELTWQMGRPILYSPDEILRGFQERALHMIDIAPDSLKDIKPEPQKGFKRYIQRVPLGTVLILAPWNYPYLTAVNALIPALLAGNTVIIKHATQTPLCAERLVDVFDKAGCPEGVVSCLHLTHDQVAKVANDKRIRFVAFTGSVEGGHAIQRAISDRFIGCGLELGGKDPAYVRGDALLNYTIENLVDGAFFNSGQSCCGIERIYVDEKIADHFIEGFVASVASYKLGNPLNPDTTLGPLARSSDKMRITNQINQALAKGAKTCVDERQFNENQLGSAYMAPQVLINVDHEMDIMKEETFGPVVGIMTVKDDREAVSLMNDSKFGLTASIWTEDLERARTIGEKLETGTVFMNRCDYLDPALAWTGVRDSGRGCTLSSLGFASFTRPKSFHLKSHLR